jgi:CRISPR/Cas system-associated exonuclease Cas4 (RecB family)
MPKIIENEVLKNYFIDKLTEEYSNKERNGIHVSDLVYCLRETFCRKYMSVPQTLTTLFYFLDGSQRHKGFQGLVPKLENEKSVENFGISGTLDLFAHDIDVYGNTESTIIEIKSTRAKPRGELSAHYLRQGAYYCILKNTNKFTLVTQHINHGDIIFYDVEFTDEELRLYGGDMVAGRNILLKAYSAADLVLEHFKLNMITEEFKNQMLLEILDTIPMVRDSMRWKCTTCQYRSNCYFDKPVVEEEPVKKVKKKC